MMKMTMLESLRLESDKDLIFYVNTRKRRGDKTATNRSDHDSSKLPPISETQNTEHELVGVVENLPQTLVAQKHKHLGNLNEKASAEQPVNKPEKKRRSKSQKKRTVQQLLPTPVLLEAKRQEVISAAPLVARALHAGPWPSPYRSLNPAIAEQQQQLDYQAHLTHMSMVGASIEKFANDTMMEELAHTTPERHKRQLWAPWSCSGKY
jgi:hypothetical protein